LKLDSVSEQEGSPHIRWKPVEASERYGLNIYNEITEGDRQITLVEFNKQIGRLLIIKAHPCDDIQTGSRK